MTAYHPHPYDLEAHDMEPDDRGRCRVCPPEPHHPSTAELAAFRRAIDPRWRPPVIRYHADGSRSATETAYIDGTPSPFVGPSVGGAWPNELRDGIGAADDDLVPCRHRHYGRIPCGVAAGDRYARTRREASALRSRAHARIFGTDATWPEQTTYAPEPPAR